MKSVKTRFRSRLTSRMLEAIMQVPVNGPTSCREVVKKAVAHWLDTRKRRNFESPKETAAASAASDDVSQNNVNEGAVLLDAGA